MRTFILILFRPGSGRNDTLRGKALRQWTVRTRTPRTDDCAVPAGPVHVQGVYAGYCGREVARIALHSQLQIAFLNFIQLQAQSELTSVLRHTSSQNE